MVAPFPSTLYVMTKKNNSETSSGVSASPPKNEKRRTFMKLGVAGGLGLCAVGAPVCAGVRAVLASVLQEGGEGKFYPLIPLADLTEKPIKVSIVDDKKDAWMTLPNQQIGSVFLRRSGENIVALHSLCPHAGCMIQVGTVKNPKTNAIEEIFCCPCHAARFDLNGVRIDDVAPRDLDTLETRIENGVVSVKFENFAFGIAEKRS